MRLVEDLRIGGLCRYRLLEDAGELMQVPVEVRKCVAFLWYRNAHGEAKLAGTAFFVSIEDDELPGKKFVYLVTAKHVIAGARENSSAETIFIRLNIKDGGSTSVEAPLSMWHDHPEDCFADVSVLAWAPPRDTIDYMTYPVVGFATPEKIDEEKIGVGDDLFITGLFINHLGRERNIPIVRIGNIAAMPEESIQTRIGPIEGYLIEARSIGGQSGSPVFVYLSDTRIHRRQDGTAKWCGSFAYWLLGLIHGHGDLPEAKPDAPAQDSFQNERINVGVAIVVPASKIMETINQESFSRHRREAVRERAEEALPTMDAPDKQFTRKNFEQALRLVSRKRPESDEGTS